MQNIKFYNLCGNTGIYEESPSSYIPRVRLGDALPGMSAIPRPSEDDVSTGLRIEKDADNWQLWFAVWEYYEADILAWMTDSAIAGSGTLTYGDTVSVTAVPIAEMMDVLIDQIQYDATYPIEISTSTLALTGSHHGKTLVFTTACTVTRDLLWLKRPFQCDLIQAGTGQITLAAGPAYNGGSAGSAYVIPDSRYALHRLTLVPVSGGSTLYIVT